jgi:hydrogenase/urease accessory protein HupE
VRMLRIAALVVAAVATVASAHPLGASLLELRETAPATFRVRWKTPLLKAAGAEPRPHLPPSCEPRGESIHGRTEDAAVETWTVRCDEAHLLGAEISVRGLEATKAPVLVRIALLDGRIFRSVLTAAAPSFRVPSRERRAAVFRAYVGLGLEHIAAGLDHLLFVLALALLVPPRRLAATVTAFTVGHSVTLSAAVLGFVSFPVRPIEVAIAASILVLGVALAREEPTFARRPAVVAGAFGLLHGLGFAGALTASGLPVGDVPLALFSFNVGIEIGQLAFIVTVVAVRRVLRDRVGGLPAWSRLGPAYVVGCASAFWLFERILGISA